VALKVMRGGLDDHLVRHFLDERQILASLDHPGIARMLDGGVTADGLPWFAMDYVEGTAITRYCDEHTLTIEERLDLFCRVCDAVAFAHRNLVVHRDLKPSNILVTSDRTVKLLDFGIAKLLSPAEGDRDPATQTVVRALTPEYASPEQIRGERVATASDVYSLGVLLHELVTGQRPHATPGEQPPAPSVIALRSGANSAAHGTTPQRLHRTVRGDLDAIILMAIRREPELRYATAEQLMADVQRHLRGLPVSARPDGWNYRAGKFVRRHRTSVAVTSVVAMLLIGLGVVNAVQAARIRVQADRITMERDRAQQVSSFLANLFQSADPIAGNGPRTTVREVLDSGAARIDRQLADQPELRAELLRLMAVSYLNLDLPGEARTLLERAITIRPQAVNEGVPHEVSVAHTLAQVLQEQAEYRESEALYRDVLDWRRRVLPAGHILIARSLGTLATVVGAQGRYAEAESLAREALTIDRTLRPADPRALSQSLNNLGNILSKQHKYAEAETLHREAYEVRRSTVGEDNPETANSLVNLASALAGQERYEEAESLFQRGLATKRQRLGPRDSDVATDEAGLARLLHLEGDYQAAEALYRQSIETHRLTRRTGHPRTAVALLGLGELLLELGDAAGAEPLLREALTSFSSASMSGHSLYPAVRLALGECLTRLGRYGEAEPLLLESLAALTALQQEGQLLEKTDRARNSVVELYDQWGRPMEAQRYRLR
jgi:serine/threonine-protein kinase